MRIGALSQATGCPVETIRYYEKEGLLSEPVRSEANYRLYREDHLEQLLFIRNCRTLDMNLGEIRQLLRLRDRPGENCTEVDALIDEHIDHVKKRIAVLQSLEAQLQALRQHCPDQREIERCGILQQLKTTAEPVGPVEERDSHVSASHGR
jgi:Cd(II)/Pb(II)-responsive transcriptional regulator